MTNEWGRDVPGGQNWPMSMGIDSDGNVLTHWEDSGDIKSSFRLSPEGALGVAGADQHKIDVLHYAERVALARFLVKDLAWGPDQTIASFAAGDSGPNAKDDRYRYIYSFGRDWLHGPDHEALRIWIMHEDHSKVVGIWDERVRQYYADRGYRR